MPSFQIKWSSNVLSRPWQWLVSAGLVLLLPAAALCQTRPTATSSARLISAVPMAFEENDGQLAPGLAYMGRAQSYSVGIERDGLSFFMPDSTIGVRFAGSRGGSPVALSGVAYRSNFFIGSDPSRWHEGVGNYSRVGVRGIYPGIDTEFYEKNGELEHDFVLAPGADAKEIRLDLRSAHAAALTANGDAVIPASSGKLLFRKPVAYQFDEQGKRVTVDASYRLSGHSLRFAIGSYDRSRTLVIDPVIAFATYVAGAAGSTPSQLTTNGSGTLFLVGSTTSVSNFPALPSGSPTNDSGTGGSNVFVAALSSSQLGSALKWLTFLGDTGSSTGTSVAYTSNGSGTLYVGGTTTKGSFPGIGSGNFSATFPSGTTIQTGFITSLNAATGASPNSTYINTANAADNTTVTGLAADSAGNVYISGYGTGIDLPLKNELGKAGGANSIVPAAAGTNSAFVAELNSALKTSSLVTYVQSVTATQLDYRATSIQIDSASTPNIYVGGQVMGGTTITFPTSQSFKSDGTYTSGKDFAGCGKAAATDPGAFLAQIKPGSGNSTIGFSALSCGGGTDHANALALNGTDLYLVGDTTSSDFGTKLMYSEGTTTASATFPAALQSAMAGTNANGYAMSVPVATGIPAGFTYLGGTSGTTILQGAATDSSNGGLLQLAGSTTAARADMPDATTAAALPSGQDTSSAQAAGSTRGLLYTLKSDLSAAESISYFGSTASSTTAVGVAADGAGDADVVVNDTAGSSSPFSFTSAAAIQGTPAASKSNAYIAQVLGTSVAATPAPGLTFTVDTNSPTINGAACSDAVGSTDPCQITYNNSSDFSTVVYTWDLNVTGTADNVILNFPEQDAFSSASSPAYTIEADSGGTALTCVSKQNNNGTTCAFGAPLTGSHTVALTAKTGTNAQGMSGTSFAFDGNAADAEGEYADAPQPNVTVEKPVTLTLTLTQSTATVDAANGTGDTGSAGHTTQVTYTATVKNGPNESKFTTLKLTLPTGFSVISATPSITTGCQTDGSGCTLVDIPANTTLTYQVTGLYLASTVGSGTSAGPFNETVTAHTSALPLTTSSQPSDETVTTSVNGYAALSISFTAVPTPPGGTAYPNAATAFNLGAGINASALAPTPLAYTLKVSNAGPNAVNNLALANVLPQGWQVATASPVATSVAGGATANCTSSTSCSLNVPLGGSATITLSGGFFDSATPDTAPAAAVSSTQASNPNITDHASLTVPSGTYNPNATSVTSTAITVQRLVHLIFALTSSGTPAVGVPAGANYNLSNTNKVSYNYSILNQGPDIAINVPITNTFTPAAYPAFQSSFVQQSTVPSGVTCAPGTAPAFSTCNIASLAPNANSIVLPYLFPDNPPGNTYPVATEVSAVPIAASSAAYSYGTVYGTTTQLAYYNAVDSNPTGTAAGDSKASTAFTIYRSNHLVLTLANTGTKGESGGAYPNPGYDLGTLVTYAYKIVNEGPNYAINVPLDSSLKITTPTTYSPPAGAYSAPSGPTSGSVVCTSLSCGIANIAPSGSPATFNVNVSYPDNPITSAATQDVSAIPSAINSALYTYGASLHDGTVNAYANAVDTGAGPAADASSSSPTYLYRTANITVDTTSVPVSGPGSNCAAGASPCLYIVNSTHTQDTGVYTINIRNAGPDQATQAQITYTLPNHFIAPGVLGGVNSTNLLCTQQTGPNASLCKGFIPANTTIAATLTSQFDTTTVPSNVPNTDTDTPPNTPGSAQTGGQTGVVFAFGGTVAPVNLPKVNVDRVTHLVTTKLVGPAPGDVSPTTIAAVNLDEKTPGDAQGKNDLVQVTLQVGNAGLNDALSVSVTDPLPPFFILTQKPANCSVPNGTPVDSFGNAVTGAVSVNLTCTIATVPAGTGTAGTSGHHGTVSGAFAQVVYAGKFQDNGLQTDIISLCSSAGAPAQCSASPNPQAIAVFLFGNAKAQSQDGIDLGDLASAGDSTSAATAPLPVQRAAHLHFTVTQYVQPGDAALNPVGGVAGPGIAEAQLGANGSEVINPVRYQVRVTNDGPNIATDPIVSTTLPLNPGGAATKFVNVAQSIEPSSTPGFPTVPGNCASGMACQDAGMIATGGSVLYNVDGNFDINTLTEGNSGARTFASAVSSAGVIDSNPAATAAGAQQTSLPITVVNTPAGANYTLAPLAGNLSQPVQLKLNTVQIAGITGLAVGGSTAPAVPMGVSPNPPDKGATVPLYRFGQGGVYYALGTTAGIPTATTNQTQVCLNAIPDVFQKPERVLLWALSNAPAGTAFNTVPHFTSTATMGDITTMVVPQGGGSYSVPAASTSYPPPPAQPQPAMICGVVNGLASAASPTVLAVLEPVNFAPYIRTAVTAANSGNSQPGKGVTAAAAQVDLTISPQNNYDYNDADPCYTGTGGTTRSSCNDNVQLTTFLFGGGNLIADAQQVHTYFYGDLQTNPKPQFNLPAGQPQLYLVMADQLGAQGYKQMTSGGNTQVCDPGNPSTSYTPTTPACPLANPLPSGVAVPPAQTQLPLSGDTSVEVALLTGNVGFGGSTGLIPLPQTPTPEATANVTAGQTAGFVWNWLTEQPAVQAMGSATPPVLTLTCSSADGTDLASKGITCNVQPTYTYSTGSGNTYALTAPPAIYVVTTANTAVGALHGGPLDGDLHIIAAVVFPIGAIPLVIFLRRRRALKMSGWLAVLLLVSLVGVSIGCGSNSSFKNQGGTTTTATPAGTYQFVVTATGTDSSGNPINIKTYPFAVTVSAVQ